MMNEQEKEARKNGMLALRRRGQTLQQIANRYGLSVEGVRKIIYDIGRPSNARRTNREAVYARLDALNAHLLRSNGMSLDMLACRAQTSPTYVGLWLQVRGYRKTPDPKPVAPKNWGRTLPT